MENENTEQKILLTAINCINEYGINKVTVRMIAEHAAVNVAAVNYYFRSKDRLLKQAIGLALTNLFEDVDEMFATAQDGRTLMTGMLRFLLWGVSVYPGITRSFLYGPVAGEKAEGAMLTAMRGLVTRLRDRLAELCPEREREDLEAGIMAALSATFMGCVVPELFGGLASIDLRDEAARERLVAGLTEMVVGT